MKLKIFLLIFMCINWCITGYLIGQLYPINNIRTITYKTNEPTNIVSIDYAYSNYNGFNLKYDYDNFNCLNFTEYFLNYSKNMGFYCEAKQGCPINESAVCHRWVVCDIEPQTFEFVDYRKEFPRQRIIID